MRENPTTSGWRAASRAAIFVPAVTDVDHLDRAAVPLQHGRQVSHAEIALVLIADKRDLCAAVSGGGRLAGVAESLAPSAATHGL